MMHAVNANEIRSFFMPEVLSLDRIFVKTLEDSLLQNSDVVVGLFNRLDGHAVEFMGAPAAVKTPSRWAGRIPAAQSHCSGCRPSAPQAGVQVERRGHLGGPLANAVEGFRTGIHLDLVRGEVAGQFRVDLDGAKHVGWFGGRILDHVSQNFALPVLGQQGFRGLRLAQFGNSRFDVIRS